MKRVAFLMALLLVLAGSTTAFAGQSSAPDVSTNTRPTRTRPPRPTTTPPTTAPPTTSPPTTSATTTQPPTTTGAPTTTTTQPPTTTTQAPGGDIVLSGTISGATVPSGKVADVNGTLVTSGSIMVSGTLRLGPGDRIECSNPSAEIMFMGPNAHADWHGTPKAGWNRTGTDPTWKSSDELLVAPIQTGDYTFKPYTLGAPVPRRSVSVPPAEVINLTRDVVISGCRRVMFHGGVPAQSISHVTIEDAGKLDSLGDYPMHFHQNGDTTRGTVVEGVVVRNSANHAFVAHASHGITFRDTIAFDITDSAYWWDKIKGTDSAANSTDNLTYDHTISAQVTAPKDGNRFVKEFAAYQLHAGCVHESGPDIVQDDGISPENPCSRVIDTAAVATWGETSCAGYSWPPNDEAVYEFKGNVAHNSKCYGLWTWQNSGTRHVIEDTVSYSNKKGGVLHGAYNNAFEYNGLTLAHNHFGIDLHAGSNGPWTDVHFVDNKIVIEISDNPNPNWPVPFLCPTGQPIPKDSRIVVSC